MEAFQNTGGADNTDYANTKTAQYYAATGTDFLQQKRWDGKKFVTLDRYFKQQKRARRNDRAKSHKPGQKTPQEKASYTLASSFVNFGTATG